MAVVALVLLVAWLVLVAGLRGYLHYRQTGEVATPVRVRPGEAQWWARVISTIGTAFAFAGPAVLTCTAVTALGLALIVPTVFAVLMLAAFVIAWEIQVRLVEEPYLASVHGDDYLRYAARTGRFLPGIGRLTSVHRRHD